MSKSKLKCSTPTGSGSNLSQLQGCYKHNATLTLVRATLKSQRICHFPTFSFSILPNRHTPNNIATGEIVLQRTARKRTNYLNWNHTKMEMDSSDNPNWLFDYGVMDAITDVGAFNWASQAFDVASNVSVEVDCSFGDSESIKDVGAQKRLRSESFNASGSKACREKLRRDRLNERFVELGSVLEPGKPPKLDKAAILGDAVWMVTQLRNEAQKLKESNEDLQDKIKELKAEKNEIRDEKQRLKADKEKLEQQVKAMSAQPGFLPHSAPMSAPFSAQGQAAGNKLMPFIGYPGVAMWQFMPPAAIDTSQDHVLRPPVA